ncbi:GNAT family N-acetyltransferase [Halobaculum sp. WSA2]|uniref:GNAT family N-acetyltransferase n=1 Tax=Halobaculum saliterrae TaxID=2073113 RepID=A0A6B0SN87_9EURY|nr:GNAT family N-acetyltransferase [Halobaculum saliterrae]MXR40344.1 GNAT family N-acetyltransferase [Halobaculum saliterrae]
MSDAVTGGTSGDSSLEATVCRSVEELPENQLNNLVRQSDRGTLFHRYGWLAAVEDGHVGEPRHVLVTREGNPVGFLPNVAVDLPLPGAVGERLANTLPIETVEPPPPGYGGPIVTTEDPDVLARLFDQTALTDRPRTVSHSVQTFDTDGIRYGRYLESLGYTAKVTECTFLLDLRDDWETILRDMDKGRRRGIRRALEQDYEVEILPLGEELRRTYADYVSNIERVGGNRLPERFFEAIHERIPERVRVFKATVDGDVVGRYVYLLDDERSVLHHWLSAIGDSDEFDRYPSELLHARAIRWGIEEGYDRYSFGPVSPHFSNSVFKFKEKYGGTPVPICRWERGTIPGAWTVYDFARTRYRRAQIDAG